MQVGILGSGAGSWEHFARAGHSIVFSYARSQQKLEQLAREAGSNARVGTPREASLDADVLLLAVHWLRFDDVLEQAGDLSGKVIVTCSLPMNEENTELVLGRTSSAPRSWRRNCPALGSCQRSIPSRARCCSTCIGQSTRLGGQSWCTAGTTHRPRSSLRS